MDQRVFNGRFLLENFVVTSVFIYISGLDLFKLTFGLYTCTLVGIFSNFQALLHSNLQCFLLRPYPKVAAIP